MKLTAEQTMALESLTEVYGEPAYVVMENGVLEAGFPDRRMLVFLITSCGCIDELITTRTLALVR